MRTNAVCDTKDGNGRRVKRTKYTNFALHNVLSVNTIWNPSHGSVQMRIICPSPLSSKQCFRTIYCHTRWQTMSLFISGSAILALPQFSRPFACSTFTHIKFISRIRSVLKRFSRSCAATNERRNCITWSSGCIDNILSDAGICAGVVRVWRCREAVTFSMRIFFFARVLSMHKIVLEHDDCSIHIARELQISERAKWDFHQEYG